MKFFIDTANVDDIRKANDMGVICGVTTNPSLIAKEEISMRLLKKLQRLQMVLFQARLRLQRLMLKE